MSNTTLNIVGLEFNDIKSNLKSYLKNNSSFRDIDFEASNINVLLDLLAYNTYMNAFYTNMAASEMFLDSAQLRDSIVSHAKELNYLPRSYRSAAVVINLSVTPDSTANAVVLTKGTSFTARIGSNTYTFTVPETTVMSSEGDNIFISNNLILYEGNYITESFVVDSNQSTQRFVISNPTVDTRSISVVTIEDSGANVTSYTSATSLLNVGVDDPVFFLQGAENGQYEIVFGNGAVGRKPRDGATIVAEYRVSSGSYPNGIASLTNDTTIDGHSNVSISVVSSASGGASAETIESIKFNAPRHFQVQERAVTVSDYEILLQQQFPEIQSIAVYGGEELQPPQYGRVFIAIDVQNADGVSSAQKDQYKAFLKTRCPLSIEPVFTDPEFMFIGVISSVKYNASATTKRGSDILSLVKATIADFNVNNLEGFKKTFYYSRLLKSIDDTDSSIFSNETEVFAIKKFIPPVKQLFDYTFEFGMPIAQISNRGLSAVDAGLTYSKAAVFSSSFLYRGRSVQLIDDGQGVMYMVPVSEQSGQINSQKVGTVNYDTGKITLNNIEVTSFSGSYINMSITPRHLDISSTQNNILRISETDTIVSVTPYVTSR